MQKEKISYYFSLVKFSHTVFAMPFAFIGFFLAIKTTDYSFKWEILIPVILDMIFARNAAMAFNRYIDKKIDEKNPRTKIREIPSGKIKEKHALFFVIANSIAFIITTGFINKITFLLSPVALIVILGYSFTKRFTPLCHLILGVGLALAPIGAYLSVTGEFAVLPVLISFVVLFWVSGFDIIYALQDEEFDRENNLKSIPVLLGKKNALILSGILHFITAAILFYIAYFYNFNLLFWIGVIFFTIILIYQHLLVKPDDLRKVNLAFFTLNGIASVIFAIFVISSFYFTI
jgi:4-hydroxybenzoate polyprenyltransferase